MKDDEKAVKQAADAYKNRILKHCNLKDALSAKEALIQRKNQFDAKNSEYTIRRDLLLEKDKDLGAEIAGLISECKDPAMLLKQRREIKSEIVDLDELVEQTEKLLIIVGFDLHEVSKRVSDILIVATGEDMVRIVAELDVDWENILAKAAGWHSACWALMAEYKTVSLDRSLGLTNRLIRFSL